MVSGLSFAPADALHADDRQLARFIDLANPYASAGYTYDSNFFRIDDEAGGKRADRYATFGAGFDAKLNVSQQRIEMSAELERNIYDVNSGFDYTGGKGAALWHWKGGQSVNGSVGYRFDRSLRDFSNQLNLARVKDIRRKNELLATLDVALSSNWIVSTRANFADIAFSNTRTLNLQRISGGAQLRYQSRSGNTVGLETEFVDGSYDNNSQADFNQYTVGPVLAWTVSPRAKLNAKVGYTARNYSSAGRADYGDVTARISLAMSGSGSRVLKMTAYRDVSNLNDEIADFTLLYGAELEPSWQISRRLGLRLRATYENRAFKVAGAGTDRKDDVYAAGAFADLALTRNIKMSVGLDAGQRSSTRELQDYDFEQAQLQITGSF